MARAKRLICFSLLLVLLAGPIAMATEAETGEHTSEYEAYEALTLDLTHLETMMAAARTGSLTDGAAAEDRWNQQITDQALAFSATAFFDTYSNSTEIVVALANYLVAAGITELGGQPLQFRIVASSKNLREGPDRDFERVGSFAHGTIVTFLGEHEDGWLKATDGAVVGWGTAIHLAPFDGTPAPNWSDPVNITNGGTNGGTYLAPPIDHTQDDLFWLALTIQLEAGSDWLCDEHQLLVGNVVLNRVAHPSFPNTIHGVVHQPGQYPWAVRGVRVTISDRVWANAQRLMDGERFAPPNVVFQAQFVQGNGTFAIFHCDILNTTTYFGYL